jgi:hypothetical protein
MVDAPTTTRAFAPDVFTVLLVVATLLLVGGVFWMYLVNSEHSATDRTEGGPMFLIDQR